ncbi:MAG: hypothetical protein HY098_02640 [Nitrospinae bacterium]|nr:hypothetical protein [Nitrospinota bacterium]
MDRLFEQADKESVLRGARISDPAKTGIQAGDLTWVGWSWIILPPVFLIGFVLAVGDW